MKSNAQQIHQLLTEIQTSEIQDTTTLSSLNKQSETLRQDIRRLEKQFLEVEVHKLKEARKQSAHQKVKTYETLYKAVGVWENEVLPLLMERDKYIEEMILTTMPDINASDNTRRIHNEHKNSTGQIYDSQGTCVEAPERVTRQNTNVTNRSNNDDTPASFSHHTFPSISDMIMTHLNSGRENNSKKTSARSPFSHLCTSMDKRALEMMFYPHTHALSPSTMASSLPSTIDRPLATKMSYYTSLHNNNGALLLGSGDTKQEDRMRQLLRGNCSFSSSSSSSSSLISPDANDKADHTNSIILNFLVVLESLKIAAKRAPSRLLAWQKQSLKPIQQNKELLLIQNGNNNKIRYTAPLQHIDGELESSLARKQNEGESKVTENARNIRFVDDDDKELNNTNNNTRHNTSTASATASTVLGRILNSNNNNNYRRNITGVISNVTRSDTPSSLPTAISCNPHTTTVDAVVSEGFTSASDVLLMASHSSSLSRRQDENSHSSNMDTSVIEYHHKKKDKKSKKEKKPKKARQAIDGNTVTIDQLSYPWHQTQPRRTILSLSKGDTVNNNIEWHNNTMHGTVGDNTVNNYRYSSPAYNSTNYPQKTIESQRKQSNIVVEYDEMLHY